ncbi:PH domain-containing protein [uncultured Flavonifractor sp.]|uniref:PH domain-containing protein n=1 Tax=uncultured Flavonifractor sp. TaxID=1193534 RepID=UPI002591E4BC|nr:PH domain-containing protein [uncultured Flavonifractor sp.]
MDTLWKDRKRHFGLPISLTRYSLVGGDGPRVFREVGLFNLAEEEVLLYRVQDLSLKRSLWQRVFGVGTIALHSSDKTAPVLELVNVARPREVKELIFARVEAAKEARRLRTTELLDGSDAEGGAEL